MKVNVATSACAAARSPQDQRREMGHQGKSLQQKVVSFIEREATGGQEEDTITGRVSPTCVTILRRLPLSGTVDSGVLGRK